MSDKYQANKSLYSSAIKAISTKEEHSYLPNSFSIAKATAFQCFLHI